MTRLLCIFREKRISHLVSFASPKNDYDVEHWVDVRSGLVVDIQQ